MRRLALSLVLLFVFPSVALARKTPVPKLTAGGSAIGIEILVRESLMGAPTGTPDAVFFVKLDAQHGLTQETILPADYVSGSRAYLLNVVPGEYVAVGCTNRDLGAKVPGFGALFDMQARAAGTAQFYMTFFASDLVEATHVAVGAGEFVFAGTFRVRQESMKNADSVQAFYKTKMPAKYELGGRSTETKRDEAARREFLNRAKDDLAEGGWGPLILAAVNHEVKTASAPQSPVALARDLVDRAENGQVGEGEYAIKAKAVDEWLVANPDDVDGLIVAARLQWLQGMSTPVTMSQGEKPPDPAAAYEPAHKLLDHALRLQPQNAEALYWKARLFGVIAPYFGESSFGYRPLDGKQSIAFARKAVELAPSETRYSVTLAQYLTADRQPAEAVKVFEALPNGRSHPLYQVLKDFEAFPLPEQAAYDAEVAQTLVQAQTERGTLRDYRYERVRAYALPGSVKDHEAFFTQHWPGFILGKPQREDGEPMEMYPMMFRLVDGKWVAQKSLPRSDRDAVGVMAIILVELHDPVAEVRKRLPPSTGNVFTIVTIADYR